MAFFNCIKLSILTIPGTGITSIAPDAFAGTSSSILNIWYRASTPAGYVEQWVAQLGLPADHIHTI